MDERIQKIESELAEIHARNARVTADKAWEISWVRAFSIIVFTYIVAGIWLVLIHDTNPWLKALVPPTGFLLSTLSLPVIKSWWFGK